ncbi:AAA domain-containing protein [Dysgonomonas alginatilytica]|uniref:AAA domain-containing protein n=2 Tax=Dysgonomonas alginatilytica TaxID=1605892 RepID=A0A2V3PKP4_9BACT|nr:AAA domain-containing protein [Dysgonomonas alginatilytica]
MADIALSKTISNESKTAIDLSKFEPPKESDGWKAFRIDLTKQVDPPEPLIIQTDTGIPMLHRRNIGTIAASAKVGKTFLISAIGAAALNDDSFLGFHCPKKEAKVLFVDTEQDVSDTQNVTKRVHRINDWDTSMNKDSFISLNLREISSEKRCEVIESAIRDISPDLVMLDGIVDLLADFNNIEQSKNAVEMLTRWSTQYDCHIITCLHVNKGTAELRGHLGAFLRQKGEITILLTKKDESTSYIEAKAIDSRHRPIDDFCFRINAEALPELYYPEPKPATTEKNRCFFENILKVGNTMSYADLRSEVMKVSEVKERTAERRIKKAVEESVISKNESGFYYIPFKNEPQNELPF